ncbi:MAG: type II toxin-antitoxin system PemK/MazF family toxin [Promethearchaeota archaeon]
MKGDIILIRFPYTDLSSSKVRPPLIIKESGLDVLIAAITSKIPNTLGSHDILIEDTHIEFNLTGLNKSSVILLDKIATVIKSEIRHKLGGVGPILKAEINLKLEFQI